MDWICSTQKVRSICNAKMKSYWNIDWFASFGLEIKSVSILSHPRCIISISIGKKTLFYAVVSIPQINQRWCQIVRNHIFCLKWRLFPDFSNSLCVCIMHRDFNIYIFSYGDQVPPMPGAPRFWSFFETTGRKFSAIRQKVWWFFVIAQILALFFIIPVLLSICSDCRGNIFRG